MGEGNTSFVRHQRGLKRKCLREGRRETGYKRRDGC